ncbi:type 1 fimbrial protein [Buttiauxella sp. B2]|uniref:fimbrial protein n=1 Tax=Buttiauxella sp. B2 TaxID=2587812 RepID=UPI00111F8D21|nr:fimbrial protein [Buttiauxella sp. B2]TNV09038.1 type 1 fimbrial protein [Buttiauxella sp. B2]
MKHTLLFFLLISTLTGSASAMAGDDAQINIAGTIVASPCKVDPTNPTTIALGDNIQAADLVNNASVSPPVEFHIKLIDCPAGTSEVTATFHGTNDPSQPNWLYANSGTAKNVTVQLSDGVGHGKGNGQSMTLPITGGGVDFQLDTEAYSLGGATPGTISAAITMSFVYN